MTATPEDLCRRAYARYSAGEIEAMLELFDPEVSVYVAPPNFESGTYRGQAEYRQLLERWAGSWDEMRTEPVELTGRGEWVLAIIEYVGRGAGSAVEIRQRSWELSHWPAGLCVRYEVYWDEAQGRSEFARHADEPSS
ncbi:MAG: nuclear transport factor 2 family protein [Thermoleophilaceae bacterium]|nr:nuclear transport factor 2 family protein [Thermoleophilaceae bacterium]